VQRFLSSIQDPETFQKAVTMKDKEREELKDELSISNYDMESINEDALC